MCVLNATDAKPPAAVAPVVACAREVDRSALRDVEVVVKSREMAKGLYYNRPTANRRASRRRRHAAVGDGGWAVTLRLARLLGWEGGERRTDAGNEHRRTPRGTPQDAPHHTRPKKASDTLQVSRHLYTLVRNMFGMPARAQARYARSRPSVATLLLIIMSGT